MCSLTNVLLNSDKGHQSEPWSQKKTKEKKQNKIKYGPVKGIDVVENSQSLLLEHVLLL